jgi:hypothetical protein
MGNIPTLMVSPLAEGALASNAAVSDFSAGFEQPVNAILPTIAAAKRVWLNNFVGTSSMLQAFYVFGYVRPEYSIPIDSCLMYCFYDINF